MNHFKGKQFQQDVIIVAVGYYLRYNLIHGVQEATPQQQALDFQNMRNYFRNLVLICSELDASFTTSILDLFGHTLL